MLVGPWSSVSHDPAARQIQDGPAVSGVFARFDGPERLVTLDVGGDGAVRLGAGAGLVAAVRLDDDAPTWIVTGTDRDGVAGAASRLDEADLGDHYALATVEDHELPLPVQSSEGTQ